MRFKISAVLALAVSVALGIAPTMALAATEIAILAGGCFWCVEFDFDAVAWRGLDDLGLYRRHRREPDLPQPRGLPRGGPDRVRSRQGELPGAARRVLACRRPTDDGGQFCDRGHSYTTAIYAVGDKQLSKPGNRSRRLPPSSASRSSRKSWLRRSSGRPRTTTRTITRRTRCATPSTGTAAAATRASKRCGALRRTRASRRTETLLDGVKRPANFAPRT